MKKILLLIILIGLPASMEAQIQPRTKNVNVKAEIKQDITVKDEAAIQKQDFLESQAAVAAIILKKYKNKFEEAQLMYEVEPSIENAFELANYSKKLFGAGLTKDRFESWWDHIIVRKPLLKLGVYFFGVRFGVRIA